ncbi:MAG: preQ(1) synthase [Rubrobacteraceae bacterium]
MQDESTRLLGQETRGPISAEELETVPWSHGDTDATVEFSTDELTALCPVTGQPDFYDLRLSYRPGGRLLESKALKLYLWGFRERGVFAEDLAATLLKDLVVASRPEEMTVDLTQRVRGGLEIRTVVRHSS